MTMPQTELLRADVTIVGGGAIGLATAYFLAVHPKPCSVLVVERDSTYSLASTPRASGGIRRQFTLEENVHLSNFSIPFFDDFARLMEVDGERPEINLRKNGYLFIVPPEKMKGLEANYLRQKSLGANVELHDAAELKALYPSMNVEDLGGGVRSPDDGWMDPHSVLMGLRRKVKSLGVRIVEDEIVGFGTGGGLVRTVDLKSGGTVETDFVVNAAGAWSAQIAEMAGLSIPVTPLRRFEHYFESAEPIEPLPYLKDIHRLAFRPEGKGYSGGVPTLDEPRGFNFEADHDYFERVVWPALAHRFPQFERTKCKATLPGLYDQNDFDGNPIIGAWSEGCSNFLLNCGYSGHGLMHAPGAGRGISELILDGAFQTLDLTRLGWERIVRNEPRPETGIL
ncbi:FAD-binding oxidoreductase (plasmid) [Bosea sp. F3-2]|uniref:NAD(P)/FAD-dependent oxidoreductase n=1 Tax=Bosea sp. F3-2 TaxID=2599640 RepID=UPI0011EBADD3|nr:FAD-binding oxidoreductase [Bosea sp. F3-2]QEL27359.1 FAD-binding oxidoreductase [Bosea sp. F3-2]